MYNIIHLPEYHYCVISYQHTPKTVVTAFNISFCHLLEISCLNAHNNKTISLFAHLTTAQTSSNSICQLVLEKLHNAFIDAGGEARTARVTLVGGSHDALKRHTQRGLITQGLSSLGYHEINMPDSHWMHAPQQSIDYLFSANTVLFRHMINPEDENQDQHSPSLDTQEKELFFSILHYAYHQTGSSVFDAISLRQRGIINLQACLKRESVFSASAKLALWSLVQPTLTTQGMHHTIDLSSSSISLLTTPRSLITTTLDIKPNL